MFYIRNFSGAYQFFDYAQQQWAKIQPADKYSQYFQVHCLDMKIKISRTGGNQEEDNDFEDEQLMIDQVLELLQAFNLPKDPVYDYYLEGVKMMLDYKQTQHDMLALCSQCNRDADGSYGNLI